MSAPLIFALGVVLFIGIGWAVTWTWAIRAMRRRDEWWAEHGDAVGANLRRQLGRHR